MAISKLPNGSMTLDTRKSVASKIERPKIETSLKELYDNKAGNAAINTTTPRIIETVTRGTLNFSMMAATMISYKLNEDVSVANKNKSKNSAKNTSPNGICPKAAGSTIKSKPGPEAGSIPNENTTGKIASPASNDTNKVNITTEPAELGKLTSFFK